MQKEGVMVGRKDGRETEGACRMDFFRSVTTQMQPVTVNHIMKMQLKKVPE